MVGKINRFEVVKAEMPADIPIIVEKATPPISPTDAKVQKTLPFKIIQNDKGETVLKIKKIEGIKGKKAEKLMSKVKDGKAELLILHKKDGKYVVRVHGTDEELKVDHIEISKYKGDVKKIKKIAQEEFVVERMGADEYEGIRGVFLDRLQEIVNKNKLDEEKETNSLEGRGNHTLTNKKANDVSQKAHKTAQVAIRDPKELKMLSDIAVLASREARAEREKQEKLDEKHDETIREAVKTAIHKREVMQEELGKQQTRLSTDL